MKALVIGSGSIAQRHLVNLQRFKEVRQIGVMTSSGRTLAAGETLADTVLADLDAAVHWRPDVVVVASPAPWHIQQAMAFLSLNARVLIEKPLASDWNHCAAHLDMLMTNADAIVMGYNLRHLPSAQFVKNYLAERPSGSIHSIHVDVGQYLPDWRPESDYRAQVSSQRSLGGGALLELSHELDYLFWLCGPFQGVYCVARQTGHLEIDVEDTVDAMFDHNTGPSASLHLDFLQRRRSRSCKVVMAHGTLIWNLADGTVHLQTAREEAILFSDPVDAIHQTYVTELEILLGKRKPLEHKGASVQEAAAVLQTISAMKQSSTTRARVKIAS